MDRSCNLIHVVHVLHLMPLLNHYNLMIDPPEIWKVPAELVVCL